MVNLLWLLRLCSLVVLVWSILSWVQHPGAQQVRKVLGYAVEPVVGVFSFANFGSVSLAPWIVILILLGLERLVFNKIIKDNPHLDPQELR